MQTLHIVRCSADKVYFECIILENCIDLSRDDDEYVNTQPPEIAMKRVLVVGPWAETGGVHTFMRNLCIHSNLKERWNSSSLIFLAPKTIDNNAILGLVIQKAYQKPVGDWRTLWKVHWKSKADVLQIQASDHYVFGNRFLCPSCQTTWQTSHRSIRR